MINVTFNNNVQASTISTQTVGVFSDMRAREWSFGVTANVLTITPATPFYPGERVRVSLSTGIQDTGGAPLTATQFQFLVATTAPAGCVISFTDIGESIMGVNKGSAFWIDYDNDSDLDFSLTGNDFVDDYVDIYNNSGGSFTPIVPTFPLAYESRAVWGDYDADGDLDILYFGREGLAHVAVVMRNDGGGVFTDIAAGLEGVQRGDGEWGDYDNDGDLDILLTGNTFFSSTVSRVYRNDAGLFVDAAVGLPGIENGAAAGNIDGNVVLQSRTDHSGAEVAAWQGATMVLSTTTDIAGNYSLTLTPGTYDVIVESSLVLDAAKSGVIVTDSTTTNLNPVTLLAGDANDSDIIDIFDLSLIGANMGDTCPLAEPRADVNASCTVDIFDVTVTGANWSLTSPVPWP